jgi:hypothetical protein
MSSRLVRAVLLFAGAGLDACANSSKRVRGRSRCPAADLPLRPADGAPREPRDRDPNQAAKPYDVSVAVVDGEGRPTPAQIFVLDPSTGGGLIGRLGAADRGDIDLAAGRWRIPQAKTEAGQRDVELTMFVLIPCAGPSPPWRLPPVATRGGQWARSATPTRA